MWTNKSEWLSDWDAFIEAEYTCIYVTSCYAITDFEKTTEIISNPAAYANISSSCSKDDQENCRVRFGESKCDCRASSDLCFLPNHPKVRKISMQY